ncbi:MAG: hypothetical protein V3S98_01060 [Dehalococcoidia bacterium]
MAWTPEDNSERLVPLIPGERFELALDEKLGAVTSPDPTQNALTVTDRRVIKRGNQGGKRVTSIIPHDRLTAVEVVDAARSHERLSQGLIILGIGIALAWISWAVVGLVLVSLIVGGFPILAAVYMLAGYALPDTEGELVLHAGSYAVRQPLLSADARTDAYLVAGRISELMVVGDSERATPPTPSPTAPEAAVPDPTPSTPSPATPEPSVSWWSTWAAPPTP